MCAPDERRVARALFGSLGRSGCCVVYNLPSVYANDQSEVTDIPEMDVEHHFLDKLQGRIRIAKEIDTLQHRENKIRHEKKWMRATAEAMDIDLDSDYLSECALSFSSAESSR
jgi:ATP-dependent RNA helicase DDX24/MAK5